MCQFKFIFFIYIFTYFFKNIKATCPSDYFACSNRNNISEYCIIRDYVCNDVPDCPLGDDEWNCPTYAACISQGGFACSTDTICIKSDWKCDSIWDCPDQSDEAGSTCPDQTNCNMTCTNTNNRCLESYYVCNGNRYDGCIDGQEEIKCSNNAFTPDPTNTKVSSLAIADSTSRPTLIPTLISILIPTSNPISTLLPTLQSTNQDQIYETTPFSAHSHRKSKLWRLFMFIVFAITVFAVIFVAIAIIIGCVYFIYYIFYKRRKQQQQQQHQHQQSKSLSSLGNDNDDNSTNEGIKRKVKKKKGKERKEGEEGEEREEEEGGEGEELKSIQNINIE